MHVSVGEGFKNQCDSERSGVLSRDETEGKRLREGGLEAFAENGCAWPRAVGLAGGEMGSYFPLERSSDSGLSLEGP